MSTCACWSQHQYVALVELEFKRLWVENVAGMMRRRLFTSALLNGATWTQWTAAPGSLQRRNASDVQQFWHDHKHVDNIWNSQAIRLFKQHYKSFLIGNITQQW